MAEPARKHKEIEPDIRPHFGVIEGGGQSTPDRANLKGLEKQESKPGKPNTGSLAEQESNGSNVVKGPWEDSTKGSPKPNGFMGSMKKKSASIAISLTLIGLAFVGIGGVAGPSLLLVNIKEVMVNKFNAQLTSMDIRTTKILTKKMNTTIGVCTSVVSVGCKYSTMSKKQVANFKKAGIDIEADGKTMFGRTKPKSFKFEGNDISAKGLSGALKDSPGFRTAIKQAYNPKFAGFADSIWGKAASKLGITKLAAKLTGKTDAERLKSVQDATKTDIGDDPKPKALTDTDINPSTNLGYTTGEIAGLNVNKGISDNFATNIYSKAKKIAATAKKSAFGAVTGAITSGINSTKISGFFDNACTVYTSMLAVGYAAKTVRALQLASYAILFLNVADQIKAGTAKAEDVSYLGGVLTAESTATKKSATASFGYNFAAYGTKGTMPDSAAQYLAGGGLTGTLIGVTSLVNGYLGGAPKKTCQVLNNPFVGAASFGVGLVSLFTPAAPIRWGQLALQVAQSIAIGVAIAYIPALLQDIIAGVLVDKTTVGEDAGDALTSGASGIMSTAASTGGNAPLTPTQAVAYNGLTQDIASQYAEEDRLAYSPFDITNSNTFLGSIVAKLVPYTSNMSSLSGVMSSIASITSSSFATITSPATKAAGVDDYTMCQDYAYNDLNGDGNTSDRVATDPYCNVAYGIPPEYLDADPVKVSDALIAAGQINPETGEIIGTDYKKFVTDCIDRTIPLGDSGSDVQESDGSNCIANDSNKNFYIYYIDQRVQTGMDEDDPAVDDTGNESTDPTAFDSKTMKELAKSIIDSSHVTDNTGQLKQVAAGTRTDINIKVLKIVAELAVNNRFTITELVRSKNANYGAPNSIHKVGQAVDFSGRVGINGVTIPTYSSYSSTIQKFVNEASRLLGSDCSMIGVPNTKYSDNAPKSKCDINYDGGTGPHIHIGIKA